MELRNFVRLLDLYDRFCFSIKGQLRDSIIGEFHDLNANALTAIVEFLKKADEQGVDGAADLAEDIQDFLDESVPAKA